MNKLTQHLCTVLLFLCQIFLFIFFFFVVLSGFFDIGESLCVIRRKLIALSLKGILHNSWPLYKLLQQRNILFYL